MGQQREISYRSRPQYCPFKRWPGGCRIALQHGQEPAAAPRLRAALADTPGVAAVGAPVTRDGFSYVEGTLTSSTDSQASFATVDRLRSSVHAIAGADGLVGGSSAVNLDTQRAARHDRNLVVPLVLVVVFVILALVLRALVAPLLLVGTVVLSFAVALGTSALVWDHVFHFAGSDPAIPLFAFVFLVALGVDYNIFLMTRVHEESRRHGTRRGALIGLAATGGVITSAGLVLAGTFMALGSLPVILATEIGFSTSTSGAGCGGPAACTADQTSTSTSSRTTSRPRSPPDAYGGPGRSRDSAGRSTALAARSNRARRSGQDRAAALRAR